ncbi:hypothetical protein J7E83_16480 [Arthrobacter sp. ISL-48]|uniref:hypothetical protein n=1 Tax=Arthrobacter sp. ISL-48 TaxID=2819110 RepID=UPI001BE82521|nr:hypothetical protein [Arthrobacter sp. ISL-48]MBT2533692.1 hypothetical protein [Arthrobacter sp. ISL-48]
MSHRNGNADSRTPATDRVAGNVESRPNTPTERPGRPSEGPNRPVSKDIMMALLVGLLAGLLGLAPWLITGARLPVQNLWGSDVSPGQMPLALLPLSQYEATTLVALMMTGAATAGLAVRRWFPARRHLATWCAATGLLAVQVAATIQAFTVVSNGLAAGPMSGLYVAGLLSG